MVLKGQRDCDGQLRAGAQSIVTWTSLENRNDDWKIFYRSRRAKGLWQQVAEVMQPLLDCFASSGCSVRFGRIGRLIDQGESLRGFVRDGCARRLNHQPNTAKLAASHLPDRKQAEVQAAW